MVLKTQRNSNLVSIDQSEAREQSTQSVLLTKSHFPKKNNNNENAPTKCNKLNDSQNHEQVGMDMTSNYLSSDSSMTSITTNQSRE